MQQFLSNFITLDLYRYNRCLGARPIIAVGTILPILIMSWSEAFASGEFKLFWACRNRGTWRLFCGAAAVCLSWSIRCDVELVWSCYASVATVSLIVAAWARQWVAIYCLGREHWVKLYIIYINRCEVGSYAEAE